MIIKYLACDGSVTDEEVDYIECYDSDESGEDKPCVTCKRSKNNPRYIKDGGFENCIEIDFECILTIKNE